MAETAPFTVAELAAIERDLDGLTMPDFETTRRLVAELRASRVHANDAADGQVPLLAALTEIGAVIERVAKEITT